MSVASGISLQTTYTSAPSSPQLGYKYSGSNTSTSISSGTVYNTNTISVPVGVWLITISIKVIIDTGGVTSLIDTCISTSFTSFSNCVEQASRTTLPVSTTYVSSTNQIFSTSFVYQNATSSTATLYQLYQHTFLSGTYGYDAYYTYTRIA